MWMLSASSRSRCVSERTCCTLSPLQAIAPPIPSGTGGAFKCSSVLFGFGLGLLAFGRFVRLDLDRVDQRLQPGPVLLPALHRGLVDRLAHLGDACGFHRAVGLVEVDALRVPRQAE